MLELSRIANNFSQRLLRASPTNKFAIVLLWLFHVFKSMAQASEGERKKNALSDDAMNDTRSVTRQFVVPLEIRGDEFGQYNSAIYKWILYTFPKPLNIYLRCAAHYPHNASRSVSQRTACKRLRPLRAPPP